MPIFTIRCPHCGYQGDAKPSQPGSCGLELLLWLLLIVPGVIYSVWRLTNPQLLCPQCSHPYPARIAKRYTAWDCILAVGVVAVLLFVGVGFVSCMDTCATQQVKRMNAQGTS